MQRLTPGAMVRRAGKARDWCFPRQNFILFDFLKYVSITFLKNPT
jgi:hypothetical protein